MSYSSLQNRLHVVSLRNIVSTDHLRHFWLISEQAGFDRRKTSEEWYCTVSIKINLLIVLQLPQRQKHTMPNREWFEHPTPYYLSLTSRVSAVLQGDWYAWRSDAPWYQYHEAAAQLILPASTRRPLQPSPHSASMLPRRLVSYRELSFLRSSNLGEQCICYDTTMAISAWPSLRRMIYLSMLYSRTHGNRTITKKSHMQKWWAGLARARRVSRRLGSVENELEKMVCHTFGLIPAVSTRKTRPNSGDPSTLSSVGIAMHVDVISICRMFWQGSEKQRTSHQSRLGNWAFRRVDGSLEAGHSKSSLPQLRWSFSPSRVSDLVTRALSRSKFAKQQTFPPLLSKQNSSLNFTSMSECGG